MHCNKAHPWPVNGCELLSTRSTLTFLRPITASPTSQKPSVPRGSLARMCTLPRRNKAGRPLSASAPINALSGGTIVAPAPPLPPPAPPPPATPSQPLSRHYYLHGRCLFSHIVGISSSDHARAMQRPAISLFERHVV